MGPWVCGHGAGLGQDRSQGVRAILSLLFQPHSPAHDLDEVLEADRAQREEQKDGDMWHIRAQPRLSPVGATSLHPKWIYLLGLKREVLLQTPGVIPV